MDVSKMREVFMKFQNERKAVKKETKPGTSEFTPVLDKMKSKEIESDTKESNELDNKSLSEPAAGKEEKSISTEDNTQNTEEKEKKVETPMFFQPSILNLIQMYKSESSEEDASKITKLLDAISNTKMQGNSENKELNILLNFLKQTSEQLENGQTISTEMAQVKLNNINEIIEKMEPSNFLESLKGLLLNASEEEGKPILPESIKSDPSNLKDMIKSELAHILKVNKEIKSSDVKVADFKVDNQGISKEQETLLPQDLIPKVEKVKKAVEGLYTRVNAAGSPEDKADKLLKSLLSDESSKGHKDNVNDKLFNFLTQFESTSSSSEVKLQEGFTVNKNNFSQDIIKAVKFMQVNDLKDLTVKIAPKELGEVIIKLTMDKGVMKASLSTSNKEAYSILSSNLADMNQKLNHSDIKIQEFSINIYNGDTTFFSEEFNRQNQQQPDRKSSLKTFTSKDDDILAIDENKDTDTSNVNILA